ncbi:hypothetical protein [Nostoc sp. LPT]|uniref:hypothetical protein n=1 Tax=Nostoc sp. LPT TaxID=2815387 RepID=UPI003455669F
MIGKGAIEAEDDDAAFAIARRQGGASSLLFCPTSENRVAPTIDDQGRYEAIE